MADAPSNPDFKLTTEEIKALRATMEKNVEYANASAQEQRKLLAAQMRIEKHAMLTSDSAKTNEKWAARADARDEKKKKDEEDRATAERANEERNIQILEGLTGFAKMAEIGRQKAEKLKKAAAGKIKDWGVKKLAQVKEGALKLLDMLKKGLGLAALWALFWFIKNQPWKSLSEEVKKNIQIITDGIMGISGWLGIAQFKKWLSSSKEGANVGIRG